MPYNGWLAEVPREHCNLQRVCWLDPELKKRHAQSVTKRKGVA